MVAGPYMKKWVTDDPLKLHKSLFKLFWENQLAALVAFDRFCGHLHDLSEKHLVAMFCAYILH